MQTSLIQNAHGDLVTDAAYDFYGVRLATCSLDHRIKIWQLDESDGTWTAVADWKAHGAAVTKLSWAHPEFGSVLASSSFDRTVKVWEEIPAENTDQPQTNGASTAANGPGTRWLERAVLADAKGTVRAVEFAPHQLGLKLATIASDNHLRVYECPEVPALTNWTLAQEADVPALPSTSTSRPHTYAAPTPTHVSGTPAADASLGAGGREADGGCRSLGVRSNTWGEVLATAAAIVPIVPVARPITLLSLDPPAYGIAPYAVTSVAWATSCGRSYHLVATGSRDGHVRIWKLRPSSLDEERIENSDDCKVDGERRGGFDIKVSSVGRVEWNITGYNYLSSAGNDGRIRLWKPTTGNIWRPAGHITVEQAEEQQKEGDVEMDDGNPAE
ncbi:WD40 repeat-like protein [Lactarius hengduanensis]|nr:WD40 repeat-like protein [Lactarius hengduanensis]